MRIDARCDLARFFVCPASAAVRLQAACKATLGSEALSLLIQHNELFSGAVAHVSVHLGRVQTKW